MMNTITSYKGIRVEDLAVTAYLNSTVTGIADVGKPVSIDPAADFTVGISPDGVDINGVLTAFENRSQDGVKTGSYQPLMYQKFSYTGTAPTRGGRVVGNGLGGVKTAGAGVGMNTVVVAVNTTTLTCEVLLK
jgi:hypothetical protein